MIPFCSALLQCGRKHNLVSLGEERVALVGMPAFLLLKKVRLVLDKLLKVRTIFLTLLDLSIAKRVFRRKIHFRVCCKGIN